MSSVSILGHGPAVSIGLVADPAPLLIGGPGALALGPDPTPLIVADGSGGTTRILFAPASQPPLLAAFALVDGQIVQTRDASVPPSTFALVNGQIIQVAA